MPELKIIPIGLQPELFGYLAFNDLEPANAKKYFNYRGFKFMVCKHNKDWCICEFTTGLRVEYWHKTVKEAVIKATERLDKECKTDTELSQLIEMAIKKEGYAPQVKHFHLLN